MNDSRIIPLIAGLILGAAICWLLMRSPSVSSPRMEQLVRDSTNYVEYRRLADARYMRLDSAYRHDTDSLTFAIDELLRSRPSRRQSHSADADTVRARVIQRLYR